MQAETTTTGRMAYGAVPDMVDDASRSRSRATDQLVYGGHVCGDTSRRLPSTAIASSRDERVASYRSYRSRRLSHSESTDWCGTTARCSSLEATAKKSRVGRRSFAGSSLSSSRDDDMKARLERSRQSARECRARKKLRYQYLEELVAHREEAVLLLRQELEMYKQWCKEIDEGRIPEELMKKMAEGDISNRDPEDDENDDDGDRGGGAETSVTSATSES